jgi:hypothetical protein
MRKNYFLIIFILVISNFTLTANAQTCEIGDIKLAHCNETPQNFKSVLLTVHGWGGSCRTTFGRILLKKSCRSKMHIPYLIQITMAADNTKLV